jgi:hypothetical protein
MRAEFPVVGLGSRLAGAEQDDDRDHATPHTAIIDAPRCASKFLAARYPDLVLTQYHRRVPPGVLTVAVTGDSTERRLVLRGRLDEAAQLVREVGAWTARRVIIDTGELTFINSIGIREWMHFLAALTSAGATVIHDRCSEPLVEQMCFIPAVRAGGTVRSFHAPYLCPACGAEASLLVDVETHRESLRALRAPPMPCPSCQQPMELADLPERLFAFLRE